MKLRWRIGFLVRAVSILCAVLCADANGALLRVPFRYAEEPAAAERLWSELDAHPGAFSELALFSRSYHSVKSLAHHRAFLPQARAFLDAARRRGFVVGVNVLTSLGFDEDEADPAMDALPAQVGRNGRRKRGALCPSSPQVLQYVTDLYRLYASAGPSFIYVDDDVTCADCWCTNCLAAFGRTSGLLAAGATASDLSALLSSGDVARRQKARAAWVDWSASCHAGVYAAAARGAHEVDPRISVGIMTCANTMSDDAPARWTEAVRGAAEGVVRYRPGGGNWTDGSLDGAVRKAELNVLQVCGLPADVRVQAEIENFPYNSLKKSSDYMGWESLIDLAWNADEIAYNFMSWDVNDLDEYVPFLSKAASVAASERELTAAFGRKSAIGIAYPFAQSTYLDVASSSWRGWAGIPVPAALACIGLPTASSRESTCVFLLDASLARGLADAELVDVLSRGVLMDASALEAVNARGFGRLTGFASDGRAPRDAITRDLDMPLNIPGRRFRVLFALNGREPGVALVKKTAEGARFVSEATDYVGKHYGFAGGVYENERGGRVAVETMATFGDCEGKPRCEHLKRLMAWLSRDKLPAFVSSFHRASVRVRGDAAFVTNMASGTLSDVEIALLGTEPRRATFFCGGAKTSEATLVPFGTNGVYGLYRLASLPHLGQALIRRGN